MNQRQEKTILKNLAKAFLSLESEKECEAFLRDVCTFSELKAMNERLEVVKRVQAGQAYRSIAKDTGASTATITRVAHWFHHGRGGYQVVLNRLH